MFSSKGERASLALRLPQRVLGWRPSAVVKLASAECPSEQLRVIKCGLESHMTSGLSLGLWRASEARLRPAGQSGSELLPLRPPES